MALYHGYIDNTMLLITIYFSLIKRKKEQKKERKIERKKEKEDGK